MTLATISRNRFTDTRIRHSPGIRFIPPNPHTRANTAAVRISSVAVSYTHLDTADLLFAALFFTTTELRKVLIPPSLEIDFVLI